MQVVALGSWRLANVQRALSLGQAPPWAHRSCGRSAGPGLRPAQTCDATHRTVTDAVVERGPRGQPGRPLTAQRRSEATCRGRGGNQACSVMTYEAGTPGPAPAQRSPSYPLVPAGGFSTKLSPGGPHSDGWAPPPQRDSRDTNWHVRPETAPLTGICVI